MQFAVSACIGVVALAIALVLRTPLAFSIGANAFFAAYTVIVVAQMPLLTGRYLSKNARATDQPALVIFAVTLIVVTVAISSLFHPDQSRGQRAPVELTLRAAVVPLGWLTIHTMAALHYAHLYWRPRRDRPGSKAKQKEPHRRPRISR